MIKNKLKAILQEKDKRNAFVLCCRGTAAQNVLTSFSLLLTHPFYEKKKKKRIKLNFLADIFCVLFLCFIPLPIFFISEQGTP